MSISKNELYSTIFKRKSVRKYNMNSLSADRLDEIKEYAENLSPVIQDIKYQFVFLGPGDVKNIMPIKAPRYICIYSEKKDGYLMNAGYLLQQVDLFLSAGSMGSCWLGMAKPNGDIPAQKNGLDYVIMLAFGDTDENIHRENISQFRRNSLSEITNIKDSEQLLEPVRLSPSASNTQCWYFSGSLQDIVVSRKKLNLIKASLYGKMNQIDIGIALCHLELSLDHMGKTAEFDFRTKAEVPEGREFMARVKVS